MRAIVADPQRFGNTFILLRMVRDNAWLRRGGFGLADVVRVFRAMRAGRYDAAALERRLLDQGLFSRLFLKRLGDRVDASWKMFPLGLLFGLGFDTATEVGLLAIAAGVATQQMPILAVLSLPLIFAAGMSLMDTADGALMSHAYGWAFSKPVLNVFDNLALSSLSGLVP